MDIYPVPIRPPLDLVEEVDGSSVDEACAFVMGAAYRRRTPSSQLAKTTCRLLGGLRGDFVELDFIRDWYVCKLEETKMTNWGYDTN